MADLYGLSAADRDVLMRMIQRERANYSANVRSLAPVPRKKIEWKASSPGIVAGLTKESAQAYSGGATADIKYQQGFTSDVDYLEPKQTSGSYTHIEIKKEGIYLLACSGNFSADAWAYTTSASDISDGFTRASVWGELRDTNGSTVTTFGDGDATSVLILSGQRFGFSHTSAYAVVSINTNLMPLNLRMRIYLNDTGKDIDSITADGQWYMWRAGEMLDDF